MEKETNDMAIDLGPKLGLLINANIGEEVVDQIRPLLRFIDAMMMGSVIQSNQTVPPIAPSNGDAYLLLGTPTGAWAGHANAIAVWSTEITRIGSNTKVPGWDFWTPNDGWTVWDTSAAVSMVFKQGAWGVVTATGGSATKTIEYVFAGAGSVNVVHGLNSMYPLVTGYVKSGTSTYTLSPVDANTMSVTTNGAADLVLAFAASSPITPSFSFSVTPTSTSFSPTMGGTQTVTYDISQTAVGGFTGEVTYSVSNLADGMSGSYSPATITGTGTSILSITFTAGQAPGTINFTVTGTDGTTATSTNLNLTLTAINSGLVSGWAMQDGPDSFTDSAGSNNLTAMNVTVADVAGLGPNAAVFNGTSSKVTGVADVTTNFNGATPFSVTLWATLTDLTTNVSGEAFLSTVDSSNNFVGYGFELTRSTQLNLLLISNLTTNDLLSVTSPTIAPSPTAPTFLCVTYDGSKNGSTGVSMYSNGVQLPVSVAANSLTGSTESTLPISVGSRPDGTEILNGNLGFLRIYDRVLTPSEISTYFAAGAK